MVGERWRARPPTRERAGAGVTSTTAAPDDGAVIEPPPPGPTDGRAARAARTRQAIVDGLLSLLEEGDIQPTANRIADRAGISLRLIYHHFGDLESLFRATAIRQAERMSTMVEPIDPSLPLDERIDQFCAQRARTLEWITPVRRAALLHEPFSDELRRARDAFGRAGDREVATVFATEIDRLPPPDDDEVRSALGMASGWNAWDALRSSGRPFDQAAAVVHRTVRSLLAP